MKNNPTRMFYTATDFCNCAEYIFDSENSFFKGYQRPAIVNCAFACEIYLKALLETQNIKSKTHNLNDLFQELPEEWKNDILNDISRSCFNLVDMFGRSQLENISEAFVKWRYNYEYTTLKIDISFLRTFCKVIREYCCKELFNSTWSIIKETMTYEKQINKNK